MSGNESVEDALSPLEVDAELWDENDFIEEIISRDWEPLDRLRGDVPGWAIEAIDEDVESRQIRLRSYLEPLGLMPRLRRGTTSWRIRILPLPRSPAMVKGIVLLCAWVASIICLLAMGVRWIAMHNDARSWMDLDVWLQSALFYTTPVLLVLVIVDRLDATFHRQVGMSRSGMLPIPCPIALPGWPFGLLGMTSVPRIEAQVWMDRKTLLRVSFTTPLILLFSGVMAISLGIYLTPSLPSGVQGDVLRIPPVISSIFGLFLGDAELARRSAWAHPLALSGMFFLMSGWISLLPLPTFPGGRLLVGVLGPENANGRLAQTVRLAAIILLLLMVLQYGDAAASATMVWLALALIGLTLNHQFGSNPGIPLMLDPDQPVASEVRWRVSVLLIVGILVACPSLTPINDSADRGSLLVFGSSSFNVDAQENSTGSLLLPLEQQGLTSSSWYVNGAVDPMHDAWNLTMICPGSMEHVDLHVGCAGEDLAPGKITEIELSWITPPAHQVALNPVIALLLDGVPANRVEINVKRAFRSLSVGWEMATNHMAPTLSMEFQMSDTHGHLNLSLLDPAWSLDMNSQIIDPSNSVMSIRAIGGAGAIHGLNTIDRYNRPHFSLDGVADDGTRLSWSLPILAPLQSLATNSEGLVDLHHGDLTNASSWGRIPAPSWALDGHVILSSANLSDVRDAGCGQNPRTPIFSSDGIHVRPSSIRSTTMPGQDFVNLTVETTGLSAMRVCYDPSNQSLERTFSLQIAPAIGVNDGQGWHAAWIGHPILVDPTTSNHSVSFTLFNPSSENVEFRIESMGTLQLISGRGWNLADTSPISIPAHGSIDYVLRWSQIETGDRLRAWLDFDERGPLIALTGEGI